MVYPIEKLTVIPFIKCFIKKVNGLENLPAKTGFIIAANHSSYADHLIIGSIIVDHYNEKLHFLAKKEHFDSFYQKAWHKHVGAIPLNRVKGGEKALKIAVHYLKSRKIIGIYPEGTRTLTGKIQKAKTGVARLALAAKVPVLPIGLIGTFKLLPKGKYFPKFKKATANIGKPLYFDKYYGKQNNHAVLREVTTIIMKEIAKLSNQTYNY